jgi:16S rRNA processing protein RimM
MASASELTWWIPISSTTKLRVGRLLKAHGLKGAIKLELYTDSPKERFRVGAVLELQVPEDSLWFGKFVTVADLKWYNTHPVIFLEGISDRDGAEGLTKAILLVDQPLDASPAEPDAWYDHQLAGLKVMRQGLEIGELIRVDHMPAQDLLIIKTSTGEVLLPFVKAFVPRVDVSAGLIEITPPGGLFEEIETADED